LIISSVLIYGNIVTGFLLIEFKFGFFLFNYIVLFLSYNFLLFGFNSGNFNVDNFLDELLGQFCGLGSNILDLFNFINLYFDLFHDFFIVLSFLFFIFINGFLDNGSISLSDFLGCEGGDNFVSFFNFTIFSWCNIDGHWFNFFNNIDDSCVDLGTICFNNYGWDNILLNNNSSFSSNLSHNTSGCCNSGDCGSISLGELDCLSTIISNSFNGFTEFSSGTLGTI